MAFYYLIQDRLPQRAQRWHKERQSNSSFVSFVKTLSVPCGKILRGCIALLTFVSILIVLPAGMSRASWVAAIGGCGVVLFFYSAQRYGGHRVSQRKILLFVMTAVLLAGCVGMYLMKKDSADGRAFIWKNAIRTVWHHPMGVGIGNFAGSYGETQAAYFASGKGTEREQFVAGNPDYAFNEYLQICIEHGVIPFVLFVGLVGYAIVEPLKKYVNRKGHKEGTKDTKAKRKKEFIRPDEALVTSPLPPSKGEFGEWVAGVGALVALLIVAAMSYPFSVLPFLIVFVFLLAMSGMNGTRMTQIRQMNADKKIKSAKIPKICVICMPFLCISLTAFCLYIEFPKYQAYKKWNTDRFLYTTGLYRDVVKNYEEPYPLLNDQIKFLFEYAQSLSKTEQYEESNQVLEKAIRISCDPMLYNVMGNNYKGMGEYGKAENMYLCASHIVPNRHYPLYLLMKLYEETGQIDKAKAMADALLEKPIKVPSTAIREMQEEAKKITNH